MDFGAPEQEAVVAFRWPADVSDRLDPAKSPMAEAGPDGPLGPPARSVQLPRLVDHALASGAPHYIGRGLNRWSNVHIADVAQLYLIALERAAAGSFAFVENGEAAFRDMADAIGRRLDLGTAQSMDFEAAAALWGSGMAAVALASNSRARGKLGRELGWAPKHDSVIRWIEDELTPEA